MNDYLLAVILGIVEGVTEFLPVSSTAHLRFAQHYLGISLESEFWKMFAIVIQLGAILSVIVLYRERLQRFTGETIAFLREGRGAALLRHPAGLIAIAFVCTAIPAFLLKKVIGANLESLSLMAGSLLVGGIVMALVDWLCRNPAVHAVESMRPWQAVAVGFVQVLSAVFPGTSRSMSTIAGGQLVGLSRGAALEFSFFVSIPVMIVATLYDLLKYVKEFGAASLGAHEAGVLATGFVVSAIVAYAVIAWFLSYVRTRGFLPFAVYRIALAGVLFYALR